MQNKISILMATYNGEHYIKSQINSLRQQTYSNWILYIQDDGSCDNTIKIIKEYMKYDDRIILLENNKKQGVGMNFLSMLKYVNTDYAIFCDQDDIWLERKIEFMVNFANKNEMSISPLPSILYTDGYPYIDDTNEIIFSSISTNHAKKLKDFLFFNGGYQGCSILFNKAMVMLLRDYNDYIHHHDDLISLAAHSLGNVYFLPQKLMLYRQHSKAVTGNKKFKYNYFTHNNSVDYLLSLSHHKCKLAFYKNFNHRMDIENKKIFDSYILFSSNDKNINDIFILLKNKFTLGGSRIKLLIKYFIRKKFSQ